MGNSPRKQHYETAQKTGVFKLANKMEKFPPKLLELSGSLRTLDLSENKITSIPDHIDKFNILKHLRLNRNCLTSLPDNIGLLMKLESLCVADNLLSNVPLSIGQLRLLKQINLSGNQLTEVPDVFKELIHLDILDLGRNKISEIPSHVQNVRAVELILNQNQITTISEDIAMCPRLRTLRLEENCLSLPAVPRSLLKDSKVSVLTLEGNLFEMKSLFDVDGYSDYMDRYTATKKKMY